MNEEIVYPPIPVIDDLIPLDMQLLYLGCSLSNVVIDKENQTLTIPDSYSYNEELILSWQNILDEAISNYKASLEEGQEMAENDRLRFLDIQKKIDYVKSVTGL